jgi:hypothetical protein
MEDFIRIWPGKFPEDICKETIETFEKIISDPNYKDLIRNDGEEFSNKSLGRKDLSIFLETPEFNKSALCTKYIFLLQECLKQYVAEFTQLNNQPYTNHSILKIQRTLPMGGYHNFHYESSGMGPKNWSRELVWMVYLNDMPDGEAETEFLYQCRRIKPTQGTVVMWPAGMTHVHRGNTVFTQPKYIATGWYHKIQKN